MKQFEKEFGIEYDANDEENQVRRGCNNNEYYDSAGSDDVDGAFHAPWRDCLDHDSAPYWPHIYSYLRGISFLASSDKKSDNESTLFDPLISSTSSGEEAFPLQSSARESRTSVSQPPSPDRQCSYAQSVLNATNVLCGIGILSMPYSLKEGGWLSLVLLFLFGVITCYTGISIKRCLENSSQLQTYPDVRQAAFGLIGRIFISAVLYAELYSSCAEYLIMMRDNLSASFPNAQLNVAGIHFNSYQLCAIVSTVTILPTVWLRNLSLLSYVSVGGVVTLFIAVLCLLWVGAASDVGFHLGGKAFCLTNLPITVEIFSFCYGGHSIFPNIYSSMKEPSSFLVSGFLYSGVAIYGFLMFGDATYSQYTLNLPTNMVVSKIAGWSMVVTTVTKFAMTMTPIALGLEETLPAGQQKSHAMSMLIRTCLTVTILITALTIPYLGSLMALIGSLVVMLISVILPCACYLGIDRGKLAMSKIVICSMVLVMGVVCAVLGTYSSLTSMAGK